MERNNTTYFAVDSTEVIVKRNNEIILNETKGPDLSLDKKAVMYVSGKEIRYYIERNGF